MIYRFRIPAGRCEDTLLPSLLRAGLVHSNDYSRPAHSELPTNLQTQDILIYVGVSSFRSCYFPFQRDTPLWKVWKFCIYMLDPPVGRTNCTCFCQGCTQFSYSPSHPGSRISSSACPRAGEEGMKKGGPNFPRL